MDKALKIKEKGEAADKNVEEINRRNFQDLKEKCRVDISRKGEKMDFLRRLHLERREAIKEDNLLRAEESGIILKKQIEQAGKLSNEISNLKNKDILEQKNRQVLRSQNIELKELEFRLRSSYASKAALVQLNEREANRLEDKYEEKVADEKKNVWYNNNDFEKKLRLKKKDALITYKNELCDQLINNEMIAQQNDEEYQRERKIIEQVSEILNNDDIKMAQEKLEKIQRTKQERDAFFRARDMWKSKEREAILNEFNKNAEIFRLKMIEENNRIQLRKNKVNQRDGGLDEIAKKILDDEVKRNEKQAIIDEIIAEEEKIEADNQIKNLKIKKEIVKREFLRDMERQKSLLKENREKEEKTDAAFAKYLKEQYETELKNDQEKKEKRRRKAIEYGKELKKMCVDQRLSYAEEILQRQKSLHIDAEIENQRLKEVSSEKLKILQEHAENLKGFFNAKVY